MRTDRSKSKMSRSSGNTQKLDRFEQAMKRRIRTMRSMKTKRSKSTRSKMSGNT